MKCHHRLHFVNEETEAQSKLHRKVKQLALATLVIHISELRMEAKEGQKLLQDHVTSKWSNWGSNPGSESTAVFKTASLT